MLCFDLHRERERAKNATSFCLEKEGGDEWPPSWLAIEVLIREGLGGELESRFLWWWPSW